MEQSATGLDNLAGLTRTVRLDVTLLRFSLGECVLTEAGIADIFLSVALVLLSLSTPALFGGTHNQEASQTSLVN